jgi:hypothetical protein
MATVKQKLAPIRHNQWVIAKDVVLTNGAGVD